MMAYILLLLLTHIPPYSEWPPVIPHYYTYIFAVDVGIAALVGTLLSVSVNLLKEASSAAECQVVQTPPPLLDTGTDLPQTLVTDPISLHTYTHPL